MFPGGDQLKRQRMLPFQVLWERRRRQFRLLISFLTIACFAALLFAWPLGRRFVGSLGTRLTLARFSIMREMGIEPDRAAIEASWAVRRGHGIIETRFAAEQAYKSVAPPFRHLLDASGLKPSEALFRWGNFDLTFWMSSKVFEADASGRSYKLRPSLQSVWLRQLRMAEPNTGQLLVPDTLAVRDAAAEEGSELYLTLSQTTNSWGCRGAEVDLTAAERVLVLGDSYMQGVLLRDEDTPPACLERSLAKLLGEETVSVLNTGVLGYSTEQYYYTLLEFAPRLNPQLVVVAPFANDVGSEYQALRGRGDWSEAGYWMHKIEEYCFLHEIMCLTTPVVCDEQLSGHRKILGYPGRLAEVGEIRSEYYLDPIEAFINEEIRLNGVDRTPGASPLYNGKLVDGHFSTLGAELWGREVALRASLLLKERKARKERVPVRKNR